MPRSLETSHSRSCCSHRRCPSPETACSRRRCSRQRRHLPLRLLGALVGAALLVGCDDSARSLLGKEGTSVDSERLALEQALGTQHDFYRQTVAEDGGSAIEPTFTVEAWVFLTEDDLDTCPRIAVPEAPWLELAFRCIHRGSADENKKPDPNPWQPLPYLRAMM